MASKIQETLDELHNDIAVLNAEIARLKQVCTDYSKIVASLYRDIGELEKKE
jgi:uncharacterized small protein (DUF1192 family)